MTAHACRPAVTAVDRVEKRFLLRARRRAAKDPMGLAWYSSQQLGRILLNPTSNSVQVQAAYHSLSTQNKHSRKPRIQVATLNVGGFDQVTRDSFMQLLTSSACRYDVICVQEIHFGLGKTSREWSASGWHVVTSVSTRFAGLAFFIRSSKWDAQAIRYKIYVPGRLLHLRLDCSGFAFDVIGVYQHARPSMQQAGTSYRLYFSSFNYVRLIHGVGHPTNWLRISVQTATLKVISYLCAGNMPIDWLEPAVQCQSLTSLPGDVDSVISWSKHRFHFSRAGGRKRQLSG